MTQRKLDKENTRIKKAQDLPEKGAAKEEANLAKQAAQQIKSGLKQRTKGRKQKTLPISVQKQMTLVEEVAVEEEPVDIEVGVLGRPRKLRVRFRQ